MSCVTYLRVVERGHTHEGAGTDRHVIRALDLQTAHDLERPATGRPARAASDVSAISRVFPGENNARNDGAFRDLTIELGRVRHRLFFRHVPARAFALAVVGVEIDVAERRHGGGQILWQTARNDGLRVVPRSTRR